MGRRTRKARDGLSESARRAAVRDRFRNLRGFYAPRDSTVDLASSTKSKPTRTSSAAGRSANLATRVAPFTSWATERIDLQRLSERMMGLEPTTFCMANAGDGARLFAALRSRPAF